MKRVYEKPGIYVENFSLSQSIARKCRAAEDSTLGVPNYSEPGSCGWDMGNLVIWTDAKSKCDLFMDADTPFEGVCYNNPDGGTNIFTCS